jgi:hypothetical protein
MSKKKPKYHFLPADLAGPSAHILSEAEVKASMEAVAKHDVCCEIYGEPNKNLDVFVPHGVVTGRVSCKGLNLSSIPKQIDYADMEARPEYALRILGAMECPQYLFKGPQAIPKIEFSVHVNLSMATLTVTAKRITHEPMTRAVTISFEACETDPEFVKEWLAEAEEAAAKELVGDSKYLIYRTGRYADFCKSPKEFVEAETTKMVKAGMQAVAEGLKTVDVPMGHVADAIGHAAHACDQMLSAYGKLDAVVTEKMIRASVDAFNKENGWDTGCGGFVPVARETGITGEGYQTLVRYGVRLKG